MRLTVTRGAGDSPAPDELVAELACSEAPATQAGRNCLDAVGQDHDDVELACRPGDGLASLLPGDLVAVAETEAGRVWRGTVDSFSLELAVDETGAVSLTHTYTVERPYGA